MRDYCTKNILTRSNHSDCKCGPGKLTLFNSAILTRIARARYPFQFFTPTMCQFTRIAMTWLQCSVFGRYCFSVRRHFWNCYTRLPMWNKNLSLFDMFFYASNVSEYYLIFKSFQYQLLGLFYICFYSDCFTGKI